MKKQIQFPYHAHYSVSHEPNFLEQEIWIVLHGYGQLAEFFIRKFQPFDSPDLLFIAPEGTNYSYLNGFEGRVGANWMTKNERETAIANNHQYLDSLMGSLLSGYSTDPKITVLGFSQGAATATRWASRWPGKVDRLILWSGGFALDLVIEDGREKFSDTEILIAIGSQDRLITPESIEKQSELIEKLGQRVKKIHFEGGHELNTELLKKIIHANA